MPSRTAIAVASGMAGLWIRPPTSSVVKLVGSRGGRRGRLYIDDVDDFTVDVVAVTGGPAAVAGAPRWRR